MCSAVAAVQAEGRQYYLSDERKSSVRYKLCFFMMFYYRKLNLLDPNSMHQVILSSGICRRKSGSNSSRQRLKIKDIWPIIVLTIYTVVTLKLCGYFYLKFQQDSYRFMLDRLKESTSPTNATTASPSSNDYLADDTAHIDIEQRFVKYSNELNSIRRRLKQLGDPYIECRFIAQIGCITLVAVTFVVYFFTQIMMNYLVEYEYPLVRLLLYEPEEYDHCQRIIDGEIKRLANSSANFLWWTCELGKQGSRECDIRVFKQFELYERRIRSDLARNETASRRNSINTNELDGLARYYQDHCRLTRLLVQLKRNHELQPINRVSDEWTSQNEHQFLKMNITNIVYSFIFDTICIYVGHLFTNYKLEFVTITDRLLIVELYFYCFVSVFATTYHISLSVIALEDKTRYLNHTRQQLIDCIRDNDCDFALLRACLAKNKNKHGPAKPLFDTCSDKLNSRVIRAFLQYRIFKAQLGDVHAYWPFAIMISMVLMFMTPIFARIYIPYIAEKNANVLVLGFVFSVSVFTDLFMMPLCKFSKYGGDTYKTLCSLLAQCMELQAKSRLELAYGPIYMEHTIDVLRKELDDPGDFQSRFTASWLGLTATYPGLVELHIYYGIVIMSLFCEISSWRTLLGDRLDDPLALLEP